MNRKTLLITALATVMAAGAAHAGDRPSMTLKTGDLDLTSAKDVHRLYDRIVEAASEVCGRPPLAMFIPSTPPEFLACRDATVAATLSRFNAPLVVALREKVAEDAKHNGQLAPR